MFSLKRESTHPNKITRKKNINPIILFKECLKMLYKKLVESNMRMKKRRRSQRSREPIVWSQTKDFHLQDSLSIMCMMTTVEMKKFGSKSSR